MVADSKTRNFLIIEFYRHVLELILIGNTLLGWTDCLSVNLEMCKF